MQRRFLRGAIAALFAVTTAGVALAGAGGTPITVQIVNDSGLPDDEIYLMLKGAPITVGSTTYPLAVSGQMPVYDSSSATSSATSAQLACPTPAGNCKPFARAKKKDGTPLSVDSPYSGANSLPVYEFQATTVGSGVIYVSYSGALAVPPSPTVTSSLRFQPVEFTYSQHVASNADLSSIDFYGIPIELTTFAPNDLHFARPLDRVTYYTSTPTLLQSFLNASDTLAAAMVGSGNTPFVLNTTPLTSFLRMIGPGQVAAPWTTSPLPVAAPANAPHVWPYPSFVAYLESLHNASYTFVESDSAIVSSYTFNYTGTVNQMTATTTDTCLNPNVTVGGWYIKLTGTTSSSGSLPANADICIPLPRHNPQATSSTLANSGNADFVIYGATQNCETLGISQNGAYMPCSDADGSVTTLTNSVYGWIQADILAALNFGYMNGKWDNTSNGGHGLSAAWYNLPPVQYPFGAARSTNDGYYNPWAAMLYNQSDAYGFAFSDRPGRASPDIPLPVGNGTLRIWILPDVRLDAPLAQVTEAGEQHLTLHWPRVAGADHYKVEWSPPYTPSSMVVPQPPSTDTAVEATLTGLAQGTPYAITIRAYDATEKLASVALPVYAATSGAAAAPAAGNVAFQFGFNWTPPAYFSPPPTVTIGGATATYQALPGGGMGYVVTGTTPITVAPPASTALLNVQDTCSGTHCVTQSVGSSTTTPGGSVDLTVVISDTNPGAQSLTATTPFIFNLPSGALATLGTPPTGTIACAGIVGGSSIVSGSGTQLAASGTSCTIVATVTMPSVTGAQFMGAASFTLNSGATNTPSQLGVLLAASAPANANITQTIAPASVAAGGSATLTITIGGTGSTEDLALPFVDVLPTGVSVTALDTTSTTCPNVTAAGAMIEMPVFANAAPTTIPASGCTIVAAITATTPGAAINTTGILLTAATPLPVTSFPLAVSQNGKTIWQSNVYLTMLGAPQSYSVGPCTLLVDCAGSGLSPVVPFDTQAAPNYAARMSQALTLAGGVAQPGPPFGGSAVATVGVPFTPVADKKIADVVLPPALDANDCPAQPSAAPCPRPGRRCATAVRVDDCAPFTDTKPQPRRRTMASR